MTLEEALAQQPAWLGIWLNIMMLGAFVAPLALFIWKQTRLVAFAAVVAGVLSAVGVSWMFDQLGYVRLLGLPHVILWTPLAIYLIAKIRAEDMPAWPRRIMMVVLATILISLAFDYTDVIRYFLGDTDLIVAAP